MVEGRGLARGEVGLASIDLKRPELVLSQVGGVKAGSQYDQHLRKLDARIEIFIVASKVDIDR